MREFSYKDKEVVVIGSGATAATLVPAMAPDTKKITMLQRSPGYYAIRPGSGDAVYNMFWYISASLAYTIARWKFIFLFWLEWNLCKLIPKVVRLKIRTDAKRHLPKGYDINTHFNPKYNPWDQRICLVPDGDFYNAVAAGTAHVVTDHVEEFTATGIKLQSGGTLDADIIVTATGLNLQSNFPMSTCEVEVDGVPYHAPDHMFYKSYMLNDIPNFAFTFGYVSVFCFCFPGGVGGRSFPSLSVFRPREDRSPP